MLLFSLIHLSFANDVRYPQCPYITGNINGETAVTSRTNITVNSKKYNLYNALSKKELKRDLMSCGITENGWSDEGRPRVGHGGSRVHP